LWLQREQVLARLEQRVQGLAQQLVRVQVRVLVQRL
jgi:hypothetical protein